MKLFAVFSTFLFLGLLVDPAFPGKFISENDCGDRGARCTPNECVTDMVFHGLCAPNINCCKRDPVPYCEKRGGKCIEGDCGKDGSFLGKCSLKRSCCRNRAPKSNHVWH